MNLKRLKRFLLTVLAGVLLGLPWLGLPGWILFFAFVPLLFLDDFFVRYKQNFPLLSFWGHAFLAAFIWNSIAVWWVVHATLFGAVLAILGNSLLVSLVVSLVHSFRRNLSSNLGYLSFVVIWMTYEYIQLNWDMEFPWLQLGNGFANNIKLIQWYQYTGVFGGTLWVLLVNILAFKLLQNLQQNQSSPQKPTLCVSLFLLLVLPSAFSFYSYLNYEEEENSKLITIVQPNIDPYAEHYDIDSEKQKLNEFIYLASEVCTNKTSFILGPETIFENLWYWDEDSLATNDFLRQLKEFASNYAKAEVFFGVSSYKKYKNVAEAPKMAFLHDDFAYERFNTALFLSKDGRVEKYHKSKLVSGVEKMPFRKYFSFLNDIVINLGGTTGSLGSSEEAVSFTSFDSTKIAPVICYESAFGEYLTSYIRNNRAELIFIITNDGWWKSSLGYKQHLSYACLRAIETRRSIARAANTGVSCFINQRGDVLQQTKWNEKTAIQGSINANSRLTFYAKHGDYLARAAVFLSVLFTLLLLVKRFEIRQKKSASI